MRSVVPVVERVAVAVAACSAGHLGSGNEVLRLSRGGDGGYFGQAEGWRGEAVGLLY